MVKKKVTNYIYFLFCSLVDYSLLMIVVSPRILLRKIQSWLTLLHWLHYGFHYGFGVPTFFAVGCSRVILQLEGLILTYPFGHELCKEEHRVDLSPLSSSWFSISNWAIIPEALSRKPRGLYEQLSCLKPFVRPFHFWRQKFKLLYCHIFRREKLQVTPILKTIFS